ncbi:MAG TPA: hypothetical protein VNN25_05380, partial [Thermoanaerobaculia bacterium]|nr:hypothetical protein [Thermoanaerobaculia bacterium]
MIESTARFTITRAGCTYIVPREHPAPDDVRRRLDGVLRDRVLTPDVLDALGPEADPAVWLIERLDVGVAIFDALEDDRVAELWGREIARAVAHTVRRGAGVLRFADRAAFIAQYVADAAAGRDGGKW